MNWFKSIWLTSEERATLKEAKRKRDNLFTENEVDIILRNKVQELERQPAPHTRPYRKVIYDGTTIQVIFNDGSVFSKIGVDGSLFKLVRDAKNEEEIYKLLADKVIENISVEIDTPQE